MKKTQIIKEIIGKRIEPYGFTYLKTDGPCRIFLREVEGIRYYDPENQVVKQYINIQESRFAQSLTVRISTDVCRHVRMQEMEEKKLGVGNWIEYTDEEDYREKLSLIADLIEKNVMTLFEKISVEDEVIVTKAMGEKLFSQHKELDQEFINEFHIKEVAEQIEDIDEWRCLIKELIADIAEQPYEDVKKMLIKMAAFIGERGCDLCSHEWKQGIAPIICGGHTCAFLPLNLVVDMWNSKKEGEYIDIMEERAENYFNGLKEEFLRQKEENLRGGSIRERALDTNGEA